MNELTLNGDRRMTVKEVAEALNVSERTIQGHAANMGLTENGKTTYLDELAVTEIKNKIVASGRNDLANICEVSRATTPIDIERMTLQVIQYHAARVKELEAELAKAAPKVESFEALQRSERSMSITAAAKHFGLHPKTEVFPYLRDCGYLTSKDLPTQAALDAGYLAQRQIECGDGEFRAVACVLACQLETWRTRVIPQIKAWEAK